MIKPNERVAGLTPYALTDMTVAPGKTLISLAQNESAFPPSPNAIAAGEAALADAPFYSDANWGDLRDAIGAVHGIAADNILCGAGSMELIACLIQSYAGPGAAVLSTEFAYAYFRSAAYAAGASYETAAEDKFTVNVDHVLAGVRPDTRVVCIANPGNPTGTVIPFKDLRRLRDELRPDILLVIDEAYGEFADAHDGESKDARTFDLVDRGDTVVLRTFSKAYGLAGMRVGWGLFPSQASRELRKLLNPNNISCVSQEMATAAMRDQTYMRHVVTETATLRDQFANQMRQYGLSVPESRTNFVLLRFPDAAACQRADKLLRTEGVLMRGMAGYNLPDCLRATISGAGHMKLAGELLSEWHQKELQS